MSDLTETTSSPGRVQELLLQSQDILLSAMKEHIWDEGREVAAICILYSGGNDSTTLAHIFKDRADYAIHANTTIGVERTRQFVRDTCEGWGLPLMEEIPPVDYKQLVLDQGFPGPGHHFKMYQRLKERCLRQARKKLVTNPYKERVVYLAGRRRAESARRANVPESEREGSVVWVSPLVHWTKADLLQYREMFDVPKNPVAEELGMSGECLCGAFAQPGEIERIRKVDPDVAAYLDSLEDEVRDAGHPERKCQWGWGAYKEDPTASKSKVGRLCSSCDAKFDDPNRVLDWMTDLVPAQLSPAQEAANERIRQRIAAMRAARESDVVVADDEGAA